MQCKDIPNSAYLIALSRTVPQASRWRMRWDVHTQLERLMNREIPEKLFMAKTRRLITRGLIGGCPCGCRGDLHLPVECISPSTCCGRQSTP